MSGDVQDLYDERLSDDGAAAEFDGAWEPLTVHREEIAVRGGDAVTFDVRETRHGPILEADAVGVTDVEFARVERHLRAPMDGRRRSPRARRRSLSVARATSFEAFREALRGCGAPARTSCTPTSTGRSATSAPAAIPCGAAATARRRSRAGPRITSGRVGLPYEELPWSKDPDSGFLVTANNRIHDEDYPHLIGLDFHTPFRARRIAELLEPPATRRPSDAFAAIQVDTVSLPARRCCRACSRPRRGDAARAVGARPARGWDGDQAPDSAAAAVYEAWRRRIAVVAFGARATRPRVDRRYDGLARGVRLPRAPGDARREHP